MNGLQQPDKDAYAVQTTSPGYAPRARTEQKIEVMLQVYENIRRLQGTIKANHHLEQCQDPQHDYTLSGSARTALQATLLTSLAVQNATQHNTWGKLEILCSPTSKLTKTF